MSTAITEEWPGSPVIVSVVTVGHAVLICEECGVIWHSPAVAASEMPEAVEDHREKDHQMGEQK